MKKITGILLMSLLCCITTESIAQILGVRAGLNVANIAIDNELFDDEDLKSKGGFLAGLTAEFPLSDAISFETGALLSTKGYKMEYEETWAGETYSGKFSTNPIYIDVPLTAKLYFDLGGARLFGKVGPYVGIGVAGDFKYEETSGNETESESEKIEWGGDDADFERLDYGLLVGAGLDLGVIEAGASYGYGMANITPNGNSDLKVQNRVFSIYVGIKFGGR